MYAFMFTYMLSSSFFGGICFFIFFFYVIFHVFHFYFCIFWKKIRLNYTHKLNQHLRLIIVAYFVNAFYCTNFMFLHEIFEVFQLTFSFFHHNVNRYTFTWQNNGDIVQCLYMGIYLYLQRYNFWEGCVVVMKFM